MTICTHERICWFGEVAEGKMVLSDPYWQDWVRTQGHPVVTVTASKAGQVADLALSLRH